MKRLISLILSAVLIFSAIPNMYVEAANIKKQAGKAYADIIQERLEESASGRLEYGYGASTVIYRIMDYNNDGMPELFIGLLMKFPYDPMLCQIIDVYTFKKGKAVQLMQSGGIRDEVIPCKNDILEVRISGGVYSNVTFYKLPKNKKKLTTVIQLVYTDSATSQSRRRIDYHKITANGKKTKISLKKYKKLYKKYDKPIKETFYKADSKAISNIRNGSFTYPNQKNWKVKTGIKFLKYWNADV